MTVCLDTSAYSFLTRGHPEIASIARSAAQISISAVVIGELLTGFRLGKRMQENRRSFDRFLASPRVHVLDVDPTTAERYSEIECFLRAQGTPLPPNDIWIAAHAMQHGLQVLTLDRHFKKMPQVSTLLLEP